MLEARDTRDTRGTRARRTLHFSPVLLACPKLPDPEDRARQLRPKDRAALHDVCASFDQGIADICYRAAREDAEQVPGPNNAITGN